MSDLSTDQTVRTAFAELRVSERGRFHPPGAGAARRTVRRRRRLGAASATAGLTALVVVSTSYLASAGEQAPRGRAADPASVVTTTSSTPATRIPQDLTQLTFKALGKLPRGTRLMTVADDIRGARSVPINMVAKPGRFRLRLACGGDGTATATISAGRNVAVATARCATTAEGIAAGAGEAPIVNAERGTVKIAVANTGTSPAGRFVMLAVIPQ